MSTPTPVRGAPDGAAEAPRGSVRRRSRGSSITLTGRGGIVVVFGTGLLGALLAQWLDTPMLFGIAFVVGCVLAALATRPADLLTLAVSPPVAFLAAAFVAELVGALGGGSVLRGVLVGLLGTLATGAPWLFLGTLLVVGVTLPRGLLAGFRDLRDRLAGSRLFDEDPDEDPVRWDERA